MMHIVTMAGPSRYRILNWQTKLWFSCRTFSTSLPIVISSMQLTTARSTALYTLGVHNQHCHMIAKSCLINRQSCKSLDSVCYMSSNKGPPEFPGKHSSSPKTEEEHSSKKFEMGKFENMLNSVKDKSSEFEIRSRELSEAAVSRMTKVFPEISAFSASSTEGQDKKKAEDWNDILNRWYVKYQDFIGITDLKNAQDRVTELSEGLLGTQSRRRNLQAELEDLQEHLTQNHQRITKTELYSEEHYQLFDQAREMNARLKEVRTEFENCENLERDTFTHLSAAIRDCHERERTQAEQSKYWSIIASIVSAALASVITSVNNWVRIREIKDHVSVNNKALLEGYQQMHQDIVEAVNSRMADNAIDISEKSLVLETSVVAAEESASEGPVSSIDKNAVESSISVENASMRLREEDIMMLSKAVSDVLQEQIAVVVANETKRIQETVKPQLDAIFTNLGLILEENKVLADGISAGSVGLAKEISKSEVIPPPLPDDTRDKQDSKTVVVDYSYKHIASAMAVGAGIGTLATAFFLGTFSGGPT